MVFVWKRTDPDFENLRIF